MCQRWLSISDGRVHEWPSLGSHDNALNPVICNGLEKSRHTPARVSLGKHAFVRQHCGVKVDVSHRLQNTDNVRSCVVVRDRNTLQRTSTERLDADMCQ